MPEVVDTCAVCPRLCRHACPVAEGTAREAAVPANLARVVRAWRDGSCDEALAMAAATLCTDCGSCMDACHLHKDLPGALAEARARLGVSAAPAPLHPIRGGGRFIALVGSQEDWSADLAAVLGEPVAAWTTDDGLGWEGRGHEGWRSHLTAVARHASDRTVVVTDAGAARVLGAAEVSVVWLHELIEGSFAPVCGLGSSCCGARGPLAEHHPQDAATLADRFEVAGPLPDTACAAHLRRHGRVGVQDAVDRLRAQLEVS